MKSMANLLVAAGALILAAGIVSRMTMKPLPIVPGGLEAGSILAVANTCFLLAVVLLLQSKK